MAEFTAAANLRVEVDESSLAAANRAIEQGIGDPTVSPTSMAPDGGQPGGGPRTGGRAATATMIEIQRRTLTAQQASADFDEERNEILLEILDSMQTSGFGFGGGGGGGGGGFGSGAAGGASAGLASRIGLGFFAPLIAGLAGAELSERFAPVEELRQASGGPADEPVFRSIFERTQERIFNININQRTEVNQGPAAGAEGRRAFAEADFADSQEVESIVQSELNRFEQRLRRELGDGTSPRTAGGGSSTGRLRR